MVMNSDRRKNRDSADPEKEEEEEEEEDADGQSPSPVRSNFHLKLLVFFIAP